MDTVMRWCIQHPFERAEAVDKSRVDPELINEIEPMHQEKHPRCKAHQHDRCVKDPMQCTREPALAHRDAQVVTLARMMDDVEVPKQPRFVTHAMKYVVREIVD